MFDELAQLTYVDRPTGSRLFGARRYRFGLRVTASRRALRATVMLSLGAVWLAASAPCFGETGATPAAQNNAHPTRIVLKLTPGAMTATKSVATANRRVYGQRSGAIDWHASLPAQLSDRIQAWRASGARLAVARPLANKRVAQHYGLNRTLVLDVPPGTDAAAMVADLMALRDDIEYAEVEQWGQVAALIPNDADFCEQYGMNNTGESCGACVNGFCDSGPLQSCLVDSECRDPMGTADADIDAPEAWAMHTGDPGTVTIAIIDTGVTPHTEFGARLLPGINLVDGEDLTDTRDGCPHGTHVAGIAAASGNNGLGVAGVTWGANILPVRVFGGSNPCGGSATNVAEGIMWAVDNGADICNISLQFCSGSQVLEDAVNYAHDNGVLVVSAAGNSNACGFRNFVVYPARYANSMAVSATTDNDVLANFSNFGSQLDVAAPGSNIYSTWPQLVCVGGIDAGAECFSDLQCRDGGVCSTNLGGTYHFLSGTSMATPHVTGLAALIKSFEPTLTADEIRLLITVTADDLGAIGADNSFGAGRINANEALLAASVLPRILQSDPPSGAIDARQPFDADGTNEDGWLFVDMTMLGDTSGVVREDFTVDQFGGFTGAPFVVAVQNGLDVVRVILSRRVTPGARTIITHTLSGTSVSLGYLPGDVTENGTTDITDLIELGRTLIVSPGTGLDRSLDINRSGLITTLDLLREIDLLNGGGAYDPYINSSLPGV